MPKITITNLHSKTIDCTDKTKKVLDILLSATDWMHSCGGKGRCTTCSIIVVEGMEGISKLSEVETKYKQLGKIDKNTRLSCQCTISNNISIEAPKRYQLPHLNYS